MTAPQPDPFAPRPLTPPTPATGRTGRGPVVLVVAGALALVLALGVGVLGGRLFLSTLPLGVLDAHGGPGADVVAEAPAPGRTAVDLEAGTTYTVLLRSLPRVVGLEGEVDVAGPGGAELTTTAPVPSLEATRGGTRARSVTQFTTGDAGPYVLTVPRPTHDSPASVLLVETTGMGAFVGGIFGTIASVFAALTLGAVGLGLVIGGLIWRHVRRRPEPRPSVERPV